MAHPLNTEVPDPRFADLDRLSSDGVLRLMNQADADIPAAVAAEIPKIAAAVDSIADQLEQGGDRKSTRLNSSH